MRWRSRRLQMGRRSLDDGYGSIGLYRTLRLSFLPGSWLFMYAIAGQSVCPPPDFSRPGSLKRSLHLIDCLNRCIHCMDNQSQLTQKPSAVEESQWSEQGPPSPSLSSCSTQWPLHPPSQDPSVQPSLSHSSQRPYPPIQWLW